MAGREARLGLQLASAAMHWSRMAAAPIDEAEVLIASASKVFAAFPVTTREYGESLVVHARVRLRAGDPARASELAGAALELSSDHSGTTPAEAHLLLAAVTLDRNGDATAGLAMAHQLLSGLDRPVFGSDRQAARCWRELGDLYGRVGSGAQQTAAYRKALEAAGVRSAMAGVTVDTIVSR
jgi:hypothetical protein